MSDIKINESKKLLETVRNVRISCFSRPSSFYVQIVAEDEVYQSLENEMSEFYDTTSFFIQKSTLFKIGRNTSVKKLKIHELEVSI